jgi:hypothetical protein
MALERGEDHAGAFLRHVLAAGGGGIADYACASRGGAIIGLG